MPTSATHRPTCSGDKLRFTPRVSTTSAEPQSEAPLSPDIERLPCLATLSPAPATTNAVAVETLNVPEASPPVPHVSTSISRSVPVSAAVSSARVWTLATFERITCAKPINSSTVSPFIRSAVRNAAICASVAVPDMIASIAPAASMRVRSRRSTRTRVASVMIGLVIADPPGTHRVSHLGPVGRVAVLDAGGEHARDRRARDLAELAGVGPLALGRPGQDELGVAIAAEPPPGPGAVDDDREARMEQAASGIMTGPPRASTAMTALTRGLPRRDPTHDAWRLSDLSADDDSVADGDAVASGDVKPGRAGPALSGWLDRGSAASGGLAIWSGSACPTS